MDVFGVFQIGDGAGDFDELENSAGGEFVFLVGGFEKILARVVEGTKLLNVFEMHFGIDVKFGGAEAMGLEEAGFLDAFLDCGGRFFFGGGVDFFEFDGIDFDFEVDAVEEWSGKFVLILADLTGSAATSFLRMG